MRKSGARGLPMRERRNRRDMLKSVPVDTYVSSDTEAAAYKMHNDNTNGCSTPDVLFRNVAHFLHSAMQIDNYTMTSNGSTRTFTWDFKKPVKLQQVMWTNTNYSPAYGHSWYYSYDNVKFYPVNVTATSWGSTSCFVIWYNSIVFNPNAPKARYWRVYMGSYLDIYLYVLRFYMQEDRRPTRYKPVRNSVRRRLSPTTGYYKVDNVPCVGANFRIGWVPDAVLIQSVMYDNPSGTSNSGMWFNPELLARSITSLSVMPEHRVLHEHTTRKGVVMSQQVPGTWGYSGGDYPCHPALITFENPCSYGDCHMPATEYLFFKHAPAKGIWYFVSPPDLSFVEHKVGSLPDVVIEVRASSDRGAVNSTVSGWTKDSTTGWYSSMMLDVDDEKITHRGLIVAATNTFALAFKNTAGSVRYGTYVGTGVDPGPAITGIGFQPQFLLAGKVTNDSVYTYTPFGDRKCFTLGTSATGYNGSIQFDADGFTVLQTYGTSMNDSGATYWYLAFKGQGAGVIP